jgi:protein O-GlcNAc transferase
MRLFRLTRNFRFAIVLLISVLVANLAATDKSQQLKSADAAFHTGYAAEQSGDLPNARQQFEKVVQLAPEIPEGHSALGSVLVQLGEYTQAIRELARALALKPGDRTTQINLAIAYEQSGDPDKSLVLFKSLDRNTADPLSPSVTIFYIRALAATQQTELAIAKTQSALVVAPENSVLHDTLGSLQAQRQNWNDATIQFREALRLNPNFGDAHLHLGLALAMQQSPEAVTELTTAAELLPQSTLVQVELAKALLATGDIAKAITSLRRALTLNSSSLDAKYQLGLALQASGDEQQAIPFFQQVIVAEPHNAPALTNLGLALVQTGKAKEAIPLYQRALQETPDNPLIHQDLGVAHLQASNLVDAMAEFRTGLKIAPDSYQLHYDLGLALKLKDDLSAATAELELAARLNPNSPDPPYTLGILAMQTGRFDDAARQLKAALALRPENGDGWAILGSVFKQQDKLAEASDALRKAIELIPNQPGPHITLAAVLAQQGQNAEAAAERKQAAVLTRVAVSRQRATFAANNGSALLLKGQIIDAIARYQEAALDDPTYVEAHRGLAVALERAGRTAEAEVERNKALQLDQAQVRPRLQ